MVHLYLSILTVESPPLAQGRPKGENKEEDKKKFSLKPVLARLSELLGQPVSINITIVVVTATIVCMFLVLVSPTMIVMIGNHCLHETYYQSADSGHPG